MLIGLQSVGKATKVWQSTGNSGRGQKRGTTKGVILSYSLLSERILKTFDDLVVFVYILKVINTNIEYIKLGRRKVSRTKSPLPF